MDLDGVVDCQNCMFMSGLLLSGSLRRNRY